MELRTAIHLRMKQSNNYFCCTYVVSACFQCRFGICEPYSGNSTLCNSILREGVDYIYINYNHESQNDIAAFLEEKVSPYLKHNAEIDSKFCYENILQVICNYYFSPCMNMSTKLVPTSVCPKDCTAVEMDCPLAWEIVKYDLADHHFISCNKTSFFLYPIPTCCTPLTIQKIGEYYITSKPIMLLSFKMYLQVLIKQFSWVTLLIKPTLQREGIRLVVT